MPAPDWYHPIDYADITALRRVSLAARAVFLEAFGAELGSKTGLVEIRPNLIAAESEGVLTRLAVERALDELVAAGLVVWSHPERMAYHLGHLIRHGATNPKHAAGWRSQLLAMPECSARDAAVSELDGIPYRKGIDRVSIGYRHGNQQEQEQEQEQNGNSTPLPTVAAPIGATAPSKAPKEKTTQPDPTANLIALYHEACPSLARSQGKPVTLKACAAAIRRESDLAAWKERFRRAELSDFLTGRSGNDRPFKADLLWILNPTNAEKIDAGRYDNRGKPGMATHAETYKPPEPEKIWPFYAVSGKGLTGPEFSDPELGPTDMTEADWKAFNDSLPFGKPR